MGSNDQFMPKNNYSLGNFYSKEINHRVFTSLVRHVYSQSNIALFASLFCASIVFISIYSFSTSKTALYWWSSAFIFITLIRLTMVRYFRQQQSQDEKIKFWRKMYIVGSLIGGLSWGAAGLILLPFVSADQQMLLILMLAGVTAGAVPLSSAVPEAAIAFLISALLPFIVVIAMQLTGINLLFDFALSLYLGYLIILTMKSYDIIFNVTALSYQNQLLFKELYDAKLQLEDSNEKLKFSASHDPLTRVANRSLFTKNLNEAMEKAKKHNKILSLLYIDLDFFKRVNDIYGHHIGDRVLVLIIERLKNYFHTDHHIARLGGDELTVFLDNISTVNEAKEIAQRLCELIALPMVVNSIELKLSASIGISFYPRDGTNLEALLWHADQSMYYVKQHGGNNYFTKVPVET